MTESEVTQELSSGLLSVTDIVNLANKAVGEIGFVRFEASVFQYKDIPGKYIIFDFADSQDTDSPSVTIQGWLFDEKLIKDARQQNFRQGDKVIVFGSLWVYKRRAAVSVKILEIEKTGLANLLLKFEQLRQKYAALGYFDSNRKRPLPKFVGVVGVITSISAGVVLADFVFWWQILFPKTKLIVVDVSVQGAGSAHAVSRAIQFLNELKEIEVILIMRGGGSLADLWTFNEPTVIEAIFNSSKPIVTAIGHEADTTLADMVADVRAPTPTSAASQILPNREHFLKLIKVKLKNLISNDFTFVKMRDLVFLDQTFTAKVSDKLSYLKSNLNNLNKLLSNLSPESYLNFRVHRLKNLFKNFCFEYTRAMSRFRASLLSVQNKLLQIDTTSHLLNKSNSFIRNLRRSEQLASQLFLAWRDQLDRLQTKLHLCSPLEPLSRGFSLVVDSYGKVLSFSDLRTNQVIKVLFDEGDISARITEKNARSARRSYKESFKD